jgi:hypothetical protein
MAAHSFSPMRATNFVLEFSGSFRLPRIFARAADIPRAPGTRGTKVPIFQKGRIDVVQYFDERDDRDDAIQNALRAILSARRS